MMPVGGLAALVRNPLGIIAIFLALLYGIAGLLFASSRTALTELNQSVLTWFLVLFPLVSLCVFCFLVTKHHGKLYAPQDYRSDESFLRAFVLTPPGVEGDADPKVPPVEDSPSPASPNSLPADASTHLQFVQKSLAESLLESKIISLIQAETGKVYTLGRSYRSNSGRLIPIDGFSIEGSVIHVVEVAIIRRPSISLTGMMALASRLSAIVRDSQGSLEVKLQYVVATSGFELPPDEKNRFERHALRILADVGVNSVVFKYYDLKNHGLETDR